MVMSSSSATATGSRSPSPATPDSSDTFEPVNINAVIESTYPCLPDLSFSEQSTPWDTDPATLSRPLGKVEDGNMLCLNDLIEEHAYEDSQPSNLNSFTCNSQTHFEFDVKSAISAVANVRHMAQPTIGLTNNFTYPSTNPITSTKPIPSPIPRSRKPDSSSMLHKVIFPSRESCKNLSILTPNIPEGGTKSRVETQVRLAVELVDTRSSAGDPQRYDRIGSWNWVRLPPGTATKKRTRKQGKIDPAPEDVLHLRATVTCATPPHHQVLSCSSCQAREAKRVARKIAARVRPVRSDSDSGCDSPLHARSSNFKGEDTTSIIQFNCAEVQDFSSGSVVLPLRITCYCRHHREKVGFHVHMTMVDHVGRVVATGATRPIMITDDHKSTGVHKSAGTSPNGLSKGSLDWEEWPNFALGAELSDQGAPSKRKIASSDIRMGKSKRRPKPYDTNRSKSTRTSREASVVSLRSPRSVPGTRSPSPPQHHAGSDSPTSVAPTTPATKLDPSTCMQPELTVDPPDTFHINDVLMPPASLESQPPTPVAHSGSPPIHQHPTSPMEQPTSHPVIPIPFMFFDPSFSSTIPNLPIPKIHRLIPSAGPTFGGIEVTVLGSNFHPSLQLNCVFGDTVATSTHRWSDNTLVCVLPPRPMPGVVAVWFDGYQKDEGDPQSLFTYSDESDRTLMELALQVVGLKMTGKIEDAKNVAMRIVGNATDSDSGNSVDAPNMIQLSSTSPLSARDIRPLLLLRANDSPDFESLIIDFLRILDVDPPNNPANSTPLSTAISHQTPSGQTLLHLSTYLGFADLVKFLIEHQIDLDARDRNGFTALHFAAICGSKACARILVGSGADLEVVNALGKTPQEIGSPSFFECHCYEGTHNAPSENLPERESEAEEAEWGDAEEESEDECIRIPRRRARRRVLRRTDTSLSINGMVPERTSKTADASPERSEKPPAPSKVDENQAAWFMDMIQRTLAQLHAPQGIMSNMPNLPLRNLPGMPNVPWAALPQIPMVFPIFVPIPSLGSLLREKKDETGSATETEDASPYMSALRSAMEKWTMASAATATAAQSPPEDSPPPKYTPRADETVQAAVEKHEQGPSTSAARPVNSGAERPVPRRLSYEHLPVTDQEVKAFAYRSPTGPSRKLQKKHDRMLILFWIPILFLSLMYGLYTGLQQLFHMLRTAISSKVVILA